MPLPCDALRQFEYLLPTSGTALDLASGLGGNALFLADQGLNVTAVDVSGVAMDILQARAHPLVSTQRQAVDTEFLACAQYNVIVVSQYLDRPLCDAITAAIAPGGLLYYQTFVIDKADPSVGPSNPEYLLHTNELLSLFPILRAVVFSDLGVVGDQSQGFRNQSYLVARKE